jgi:hypothetical protein
LAGDGECLRSLDHPPALHGPYTHWTRTVQGKTVTKLLTEEQLARYQPWFDNARRLKDLIAKLEIVSLQAIETADQLTAKTATPRSAPGRQRRKAQT